MKTAIFAMLMLCLFAGYSEAGELKIHINGRIGTSTYIEFTPANLPDKICIVFGQRFQCYDKRNDKEKKTKVEKKY